MVELRWTVQAANDLESIIEYIASDSGHFANLFAIDIVRAVEGLQKFPSRGRIVPEIKNEEIREIFFGNYRIIYRFKNSTVEILTIFHGARLLTKDRLGLT